MHTIKITPNLLFEYHYKRQIYQIAESNRIETFLPELECSRNHPATLIPWSFSHFQVLRSSFSTFCCYVGAIIDIE